jgi:hypothetical protein
MFGGGFRSEYAWPYCVGSSARNTLSFVTAAVGWVVGGLGISAGICVSC